MSHRPFPHALVLTVGALAVASFVGCNSSSGTSKAKSTPAPQAASSPAPTAPGASANPEVDAQIARGRQLYGASCAKCHGSAGEGSAEAPAVIGRGALPSNPPAGRRLRTGPFHSAKDLGMFIKDNMPMGSTTPPDQTGAILAFLLASNGLTPAQPMNPTAAASIPLNR